MQQEELQRTPFWTKDYAKNLAEQFYLLPDEDDPTSFKHRRDRCTTIEVGAFQTFAHLKIFAGVTAGPEHRKKITNLLTTTVKRMALSNYAFVPWNEDMPKTQSQKENKPARDSSAGSDVSEFSESSQSQSQSSQFSQRSTSRFQSSTQHAESSLTLNQEKESAVSYINNLNLVERAQFLKDNFSDDLAHMETLALSFVSEYILYIS